MRAYISNHLHQAERTNWEWHETSKSAFRDMLPPKRPCLLSLPKYCYKLETKYSNAKEYGGHPVQTSISHIFTGNLYYIVEWASQARYENRAVIFISHNLLGIPSSQIHSLTYLFPLNKCIIYLLLVAIL